MKNLDDKTKDLCNRAQNFNFMIHFNKNEKIFDILQKCLEKIGKYFEQFKPII